MNIRYTLCFIKNHHEFLMLYRLKKPNLHKWNGVGGKIEQGETIEESVIREVKEETGLRLRNPTYKGIVSWNKIGGMHVFVATEYEGEVVASEEGPLEWKDIQWIRDSSEVVSNIPLFLNHLLSNCEPVEYAFNYREDGNIIGFKVLPLNEFLVQ